MNKTIGLLSIIAAIVVILCVITWNHNRTMEILNNTDNTDNAATFEDTDVTDTIADDNNSQIVKDEDIQPIITVQPRNNQSVKEFTLNAEEVQTELAKGVALPTWTFGGTVPGTEIRVSEGDYVKVHVTNTLTVPITIHWHGYPVPSDMDGIPGYTQDAILPGRTYTYEFSADVVGTYWYHSHQESSRQVDMGLYGALIVEPKKTQNVNKDFTLILDEWMQDSNAEMSMPMSSDNPVNTENTNNSNASNASGRAGMDGMGGSSDTSINTATTGNKDLEMQEEQMMKELYNIYTVNGKSGELIQPLEVEKGDVVRLRFINAGYRSHGIHIPGQIIKVVSTDGQDIHGAKEFYDQIINIAPGERYDIEFEVDSEDNFIIDFHDNNLYNDQLKIPVIVTGGSGDLREEDQNLEIPDFDLSVYGTHAEGDFTLDQIYDVDQYIELNTDTTDGTLKYTINGETFKDLQPIIVKTGDSVKITYENKSQVDHPMHLHGHFFQVLSKNDKAFSSLVMKDTLLVKPGEKYVIAFKANNPGNWVYHCHELHHAAAGMMQKIIYSDYKSSYTTDPNNKVNNPE